MVEGAGAIISVSSQLLTHLNKGVLHKHAIGTTPLN